MEVLKNKKSFRISLKDRKKWEKNWLCSYNGSFHTDISLYEEARKENDLVISSIFVNPTQFNNPEDLEKYPRDINRDILFLKNQDW
jgi:pantoate--beta-alanine ligase